MKPFICMLLAAGIVIYGCSAQGDTADSSLQEADHAAMYPETVMTGLNGAGDEKLASKE